jgi:hypothetical protein
LGPDLASELIFLHGNLKKKWSVPLFSKMIQRNTCFQKTLGTISFVKLSLFVPHLNCCFKCVKYIHVFFKILCYFWMSSPQSLTKTVLASYLNGILTSLSIINNVY